MSRSLTVLVLLALSWAVAAEPIAPAKNHIPQVAAIGLRFELPVGCAATARDLDGSGDEARIAASVTVTCGGPEAMRVDAWPATPGRSPGAWFDARLGFTMTSTSTRAEARVTGARRPALIVEHPDSGQRHVQRLVVFEAGGRVLVVTLQRATDKAREALLSLFLDTLTLDSVAP